MNIQQLRAQIAALQDATMDENRNFRSGYDEGKFDALLAVDALLDSLQEESVSEKKCMFTKDNYTDEDRKTLCEDCKEKCEYSKEEEPVSKDLKEAAEKYAQEAYSHPVDRNVGKADFIAGSKWQRETLWKSANGDDLPEIDREVIALTQPHPNDEHLRVVFAHRPNKYTKVWNSDLGEEQVVETERHGIGGWNIPDVKFWLDVEYPKEIEL